MTHRNRSFSTPASTSHCYPICPDPTVAPYYAQTKRASDTRHLAQVPGVTIDRSGLLPQPDRLAETFRSMHRWDHVGGLSRNGGSHLLLPDDPKMCSNTLRWGCIVSWFVGSSLGKCFQGCEGRCCIQTPCLQPLGRAQFALTGGCPRR